jgi:hypothetical protein
MKYEEYFDVTKSVEQFGNVSESLSCATEYEGATSYRLS